MTENRSRGYRKPVKHGPRIGENARLSVSLVRMRGAWLWLLPGCLLLLTLAACTKELPRSTDSNGKISFVVPAGWKEVPGSSGTRFGAPDGDFHSVRMQVNTLLRASDLQRLERERDAWLTSHEDRGERVLFSRGWRSDDFEGLEYAHTATGTMGKVIWHHVMATNGELVLATNLMAPVDEYDSYRELYAATLDSIRRL